MNPHTTTAPRASDIAMVTGSLPKPTNVQPICPPRNTNSSPLSSDERRRIGLNIPTKLRADTSMRFVATLPGIAAAVTRPEVADPAKRIQN